MFPSYQYGRSPRASTGHFLAGAALGGCLVRFWRTSLAVLLGVLFVLGVAGVVRTVGLIAGFVTPEPLMIVAAGCGIPLLGAGAATGALLAQARQRRRGRRSGARAAAAGLAGGVIGGLVPMGFVGSSPMPVVLALVIGVPLGLVLAALWSAQARPRPYPAPQPFPRHDPFRRPPPGRP